MGSRARNWVNVFLCIVEAKLLTHEEPGFLNLESHRFNLINTRSRHLGSLASIVRSTALPSSDLKLRRLQLGVGGIGWVGIRWRRDNTFIDERGAKFLSHAEDWLLFLVHKTFVVVEGSYQGEVAIFANHRASSTFSHTEARGRLISKHLISSKDDTIMTLA